MIIPILQVRKQKFRVVKSVPGHKGSRWLSCDGGPDPNALKAKALPTLPRMHLSSPCCPSHPFPCGDERRDGEKERRGRDKERQISKEAVRYRVLKPSLAGRCEGKGGHPVLSWCEGKCLTPSSPKRERERERKKAMIL